MKIALLEPFLGGSHRQWAEGWQRHSHHEIRIFGLPGRHWKWRMHGGAVTLARQLAESGFRPDLLLTTDMLDLAAFLGLARSYLANIPVAVYFHENQLAYPWSPDDPDPHLKRDNHYSFLNFTTALAADRVFFNSPYNRDSFLGALPAFLGAFPDYREQEQLAGLAEKCEVLPLGLDLRRFNAVRGPQMPPGPPLLLWNHRWEYDKGPEAFFRTVGELAEEGYDFRLAVVGEKYRRVPPAFGRAKEQLRRHLVRWGYVADFAEYAALLQQADILPVTSQQDFFGGSVVEAMYCGAFPLLPDRLAYPMHVPTAMRKSVLYATEAEFKRKLRKCLAESGPELPVREWVAGYDWSVMAPQYDGRMDKLAAK
ncbi:MAG: DUF3524 domain-containing protein [Bacteroidota bacterium]